MTPRGAAIGGAEKVKNILASIWSNKKETNTTSKRVGGGFVTSTT